MAGQRGAAAGAVGYNLIALVEQPLVEDRLERPPLGLDIVVVVGDVGVFHVRPEADALGHILPHTLVFPDGFLALLDERLDAVGFDLILAVQPQLLFNLQLDRQAVRVPAGLAGDRLALHRLIARNQILDGARLDMADVRLAVGRGRAVVERKDVAALAQINGFLKDLILLPEFEHFLFTAEKIQRRGNLFKHGFCLPYEVSNENKKNRPVMGRFIAVPPNIEATRLTAGRFLSQSL